MNFSDTPVLKTKTYYYLCVIALTIWAHHSWVPGFFQDGYLYAGFGQSAAENGNWLIPHLSISTYAEFSQHTPFTFILEGIFFKIFGSSYTAARLFGVLFVWATLTLIYSWGRKYSKSFALLASLVFILTPPLMKKARFPNMDLLLMCFTSFSLYFSYMALQFGKMRNWIFAGIFFGAGLLTKGPIACAVPLTFVVYLLLTRNVKKLLLIGPWISLILGLVLFSLWPLSLVLIGRIEIFYDYLKTIFVDTAVLARGNPSPFYTYFKFLLTDSAPSFLLALVTIYLCLKKKMNQERRDLSLFLLSFFIPTILVLSSAKFKYSHYLIPLYPAISMLAALALSEFLKEEQITFFRKKILVTLALITPLVFVIFPIGNKSTRDQEVFKILDLYRASSTPPEAIGVVNDAYPFYALANLMGYHKGPMVFVADLNTIKNKFNSRPVTPTLKRLEDDFYKGDLSALNWSFFINGENLEKITVEFPNFFEKYSILFYSKKIDLYVLVERAKGNGPLYISN